MHPGAGCAQNRASGARSFCYLVSRLTSILATAASNVLTAVNTIAAGLDNHDDASEVSTAA